MLKHGVRETTTTVGTGTVTLLAASGYARASARFAVGEIMDYLILDTNGNKEWGLGTVGAANTLARTTITGTLVGATYAAGGAALTLSGNAVVACVEHEASQAPTFSAVAAVDQTVVAATYTKITFGTEEFDVGGYFATSRFTPLVSGYYQLSWGVTATTNVANGLLDASLYKNGVRFKSGAFSYFSSGSVKSVASALVFFNGTTDYAEIYAYLDGTIISGTQVQQTHFSGCKVN